MITDIQFQDFRQFDALAWSPKPGINLITGSNGAGKSSILEALYFMSYGRSFRSKKITSLLRHDAEQFFISLGLDGASVQRVGLSRGVDKTSQIRCDGQNLKSHAALARHLPLLFFRPESIQLIFAHAKHRRPFLDWCVFYSEPGYMKKWQDMMRLLKQRNQALRMGLSASSMAPWNQAFVDVSEEIDQIRQQAFTVLIEAFKPLCERFLPGYQIALSYVRGWAQDGDLDSVLEHAYEKECSQGYTQYGPHRADMRLRLKQASVQDALSRGQQKCLLCALKLAQASALFQMTGRQAVMLIDDFTSELDAKNSALLLSALRDSCEQVFLTSVRAENLVECLNDEGVSDIGTLDLEALQGQYVS